MDRDSITRKLQLSVDLVKKWGESELPNGKTLGSLFTYDSIPFWDIISASLAIYHVPKCLFLDKSSPFILQRISTYLKRSGYEIINRKFCIARTECHDWPSKPVFLFLGFHPYLYRDTIQPIVRNMVDEERICPVSLYDYSSLEKHCQKIEGSLVQSIWQHWDSNVKAQTRSLQDLLKRSIKEIEEMEVLPQIIQNNGKSLWPQMKDTFDWLFIAYLPYLMKHFAIAKHILECHRPEAIISPDGSDPRSRLYCLLGRHLNIPTLDVQFGVYRQDSVEWQFFAADRLAAWGETSRSTLLSHGVPAEKIVLTGSPRHDSMVSVSNTEVAQTRSALGIPDGAVMILFASSFSIMNDEIEKLPLLIDSVKRAIFQAADQIDGVYLVTKPHPNEKASATKKLASGYRNILFVNKDSDIRKLIKACDAFVSLGSTATVDAMIANKLSICPNFPGWIRSDPFLNSGAIWVPKSEDELLECFKKVGYGDRRKELEDMEPERQYFLEQCLFKVDGESSGRIKSLLLDMVRDATKPTAVTDKCKM